MKEQESSFLLMTIYTYNKEKGIFVFFCIEKIYINSTSNFYIKQNSSLCVCAQIQVVSTRIYMTTWITIKLAVHLQDTAQSLLPDSY